MARLRPLAGLAVIALTLANGGCAMSGQLGGLFGSDKPDADADLVTGSINAKSVSIKPVAAKPATGLPPDSDLAYARSAVTHLLGGDEDTASIPWENPSTGARGMVTPIAATYVQDGVTCRDFLASYLRDKAEVWLQGEACLAEKGHWEVKNFRPWKRS